MQEIRPSQSNFFVALCIINAALCNYTQGGDNYTQGDEKFRLGCEMMRVRLFESLRSLDQHAAGYQCVDKMDTLPREGEPRYRIG